MGRLRKVLQRRTTGARARLPLVVGLLVTLVGSSCGASPSASPKESQSSTSAADCPATPDEERFGCGAATDGSITYQPDVVLVGGGRESIRSWEPDGISWIIDGHAPGADQIAPGKVVFITDRAVGRVLKVAPVGNDLRITFGPVGLGEIIQDGELRWDEPISMDDASAIVAQDMPGISIDETTINSEPSPQANILPPIELVSARGAQRDTPIAADDQPKIDVFVGDSDTYGALCCNPKAGAYFTMIATGIHGKGGMWLRMDHPRINGYAKVKHGQFTDGLIVMSGVKGVHLEFEVASAAGPPPININELTMLPVEWAPRPKAPRGQARLLNSYTESFLVRTAFSSGSATLVGSADYDFDQDVLRAQFDANGLVDVSLPKGFTTRTSMLDTLTGVAIGVTGVIFSMTAQFCLCHGALAYSNGLFIKLRPAFGISNDSSAVAVLGGRCRSVVFAMDAVVGAGHSMPAEVASAINVQEGLAGDNAIESSDGIVQSIPMWNEIASVPTGVKRCT